MMAEAARASDFDGRRYDVNVRGSRNRGIWLEVASEREKEMMIVLVDSEDWVLERIVNRVEVEVDVKCFARELIER